MSQSYSQDLAALQEQVRKLRKLNLIYEKAVSAIADGFLIVGRDGRIVEINTAYCDYFGVKREDTIGREIYSVITNSKMIEIMDKNITEIDAIHEFVDGQTASGERMVAVTRMPVVDEGEIIASVALVKFSRYTIMLANSLRKLEEEVAFYRKELRKHGINSFSFDELPSASPSYGEAKRLAQRFAKSDLPILLLGETGAGKEVFANAIHQASDRKEGPFVCVNCASIPGELLESELFGYVEGAFTGGRKSGKKGKFELADGGTLFLDEIGDMPAFMQSKLLRVLQCQEVEKLGAEKTVTVNVRILAATNQDLSKKVEASSFRPDLFYRLNVLTITIPPLRARPEDIPSLAGSFLEELNEKYGRKVSLSPQAMTALMQHDWPGNVRELRNAMGRGFMVTEDEVILPEHLPANVSARPDEAAERQPIELSMPMAKARKEKEMILACLQSYGGNFSKAAKALGIHRATLYSKVDALGISVDQFRKPPRKQ